MSRSALVAKAKAGCIFLEKSHVIGAGGIGEGYVVTEKTQSATCSE